MKRNPKPTLWPSCLCLLAFILWTAAVKTVDLRPIGPLGSEVGMAAINGAFHSLTGVNMALYTATDWLSLVPLGLAAGFAVLGLIQLVKRKGISKVDRDILVLGGYYALVIAVYLLFEVVAVNYRPVLIEGILEPSYPSSTTLLVLSVMPPSVSCLNARINSSGVRKALAALSTVFSAFMVAARVFSGVHWLSDIVGGVLISAALLLFYRCVSKKTGLKE